MNQPRPWLRYIEAADLGDTDIDFNHLKVRSPAGEDLGKVDGFVIDADNARPYYVSVDSGGWFKSKYYLVPVGHIRLDAAQQELVAELTKERIDRFPGFDKGNFEKLTDDDLDQIDRRTGSECCPDAVMVESKSWTERWSHYEQPDWWQSNYYRPDRAGSRGVTAGAESKVGRDSTHREEPAMAHDFVNTRR